ncbi:unnamed protein product [Phytophthora lilii]|uniref:Unnamed protein product n=1 Tax=Phytophthora lilii TaxID=2077276 RepID=A0A9W6X2B7_9STRA|nr:unnamed protein product [Phytophthora lilii]
MSPKYPLYSVYYAAPLQASSQRISARAHSVTMKVFIPVVVAAVTFSTATAETTWIDDLTPIENSDSYHMSHVHVVHARAQSDAPVWLTSLNAFGSMFGSSDATKFRAALDTVNTASVEGALMFVQAEGIDYSKRGDSDKCNRKNWMQYIVFYDIVFAQTNETLAEFESEYGPFMAMDGGQCTPVNGTISKDCKSLNGDSNVPNLGPFIGGEARNTDPRAPYPDCWWYSFPNTCPESKWKEKTDSCRSNTRKGLCDFDKLPDGVTCTYNYRILGYVPIDDVVGITAMTKTDDSGTYSNFTEFCNDGGVEFKTNDAGDVIESIDFWKSPLDTSANSARTTTLLETYADLLESKVSTQITSSIVEHMQALPDVAGLVDQNPACYLNVQACADAPHGCKRSLYGQICTVCDSDAEDCVKAPNEFTFPTLEKGKVVEAESSSSSERTLSESASTGSSSATSASDEGSSASTSTSSAVSVAMTAAALIASFGLSVLLA